MNIFEKILKVFTDQNKLIKDLADKLEQLDIRTGGGGGGGGESGGGGNASIADYESGKTYTRNTLLVDTSTETVYRVIPSSYVSVTVNEDKGNGYLKLVGFESAIVTFDHNPTQTEINNLPDDTLVSVYSRTDTPYIPDSN